MGLLCFGVLCADLPKDDATQLVQSGIEESIFCHIIKRLIGEKLVPDSAYTELITNKTCFNVTWRRKRSICSCKFVGLCLAVLSKRFELLLLSINYLYINKLVTFERNSLQIVIGDFNCHSI